MYVHCLAQSLNLVVQDTMRQVDGVRDFLEVVRELMTLCVALEMRLPSSESLRVDEIEQLLSFFPTRWCLLVVSFKTILANYDPILVYLKQVKLIDKSDSEAKANGFIHLLTKFKSVFLFHLLIQNCGTCGDSRQRTTGYYTEVPRSHS